MASEEMVETAVARIRAAAFDAGRWDEALRAVASATGSNVGQLLAIGGPDGSLFNRRPDLDPEHMAAWDQSGCDHPAVNSRVRIGANAPLMQSLDESAFTTEQDGRLNRAYGALLERADIPFICLTNLIREPGLHVGMAVMRGRSRGNISSEERRVFDHLAGHALQAVRGMQAMGLHAATITAAGLEAFGAAAMVCDGLGRILAINARAEQLLTEDNRLMVEGGRLLERVSRRDLSEQARAVATGRLQGQAPTIIGDPDGGLAFTVEIMPLPTETPGFPGSAGAVIIIRRPWGDSCERLGQRLAALYGFSPRELQVATALCRGVALQALPSLLGVSMSTIRTYVRHLFEKTGSTHSLAQLVATLKAYDR